MGALGFAVHIIRGQSGARDFGKALLLPVSQDAVVEVQQLLRRNIVVDGGVDVADVIGQPLAAAVVIHHHLEKIGVLRDLGKVLLRTVDGTE